MALANCKWCGALYNRIGRDICDKCIKEEEDTLLEVQRYLRDNPNRSIDEICDEFDLDESVVRQWVRDKRLILKSSLGQNVNCESCGVEIPSGRLCALCRDQLAADFKDKPSVSANKSRPTENRRQTGSDSGSLIKDKFRK